jgi:Superfamily I DNA and RNA helicases
VVFVAGMHHGGFPHFMSETEEDLEEERRLVYVAFTRAMERLYLTRPRRRFSMQLRRYDDTEPSRFLRELPADSVEWGGSGGFRGGGVEQRAARMARLGMADVARSPVTRRRPARRAAPAPPTLAARPSGMHRTTTPESPDDLAEGVRVLHKKFGLGTIVRRTGPPSNLKLVVQFDGGGRKTLFARFAGLELVES